MKSLLYKLRQHRLLTITGLAIGYVVAFILLGLFDSYYANLYAEDARVEKGKVSIIEQYEDEDGNVTGYEVYIKFSNDTIIRRTIREIPSSGIVDVYTDKDREIFELSARDYSYHRAGIPVTLRTIAILIIVIYLTISFILCFGTGVAVAFAMIVASGVFLFILGTV